MKAGKLPLELLSQLLDKVEIEDQRVVLGPAPGEDAALIDFGDRYLVAKTDPITFATDLIGWYMVQVNANDLAVMGASPRWLLATLLLPEKTSEEAVRGIFDQLVEACDSLDISLVGGHTEITYGLPRPVVVGAMLGEVDKDKVVLTSGARPGDAIVLTKGIAIEGTALLAREASDQLQAAGVAPDIIERSAQLLFNPGISVLKDAAIVCEMADVHSMHDPTEGGLATGLLELATGAGVGLTIDVDQVSILPECSAICKALDLDPMGLIGSGALLATVASESATGLLSALALEGISAREIGTITSAGEGLKVRTGDGLRNLPRFERDELARFFEG